MQQFKNNEIVDFCILNYCFDSMLSGNFCYLDLVSIYENLDENIKYFSLEDYKKRIYYLVGLGFIELEPAKDIETIIKVIDNLKINQSELLIKNGKTFKIKLENYYKYFLNGKITPTGIRKCEELEIIISSNCGIKGTFKKLKSFLENIFDYKYIIGFGLTGACVILIFVFDVKVSAYISKLPILSSIINTETLEKFEEINANDDMYKQIAKELNLGSGSIRTSNNGMFQDIKVKKISQEESVFKITLNNGEELLIPVKKTDGIIKINIPARLKNIQEGIRQVFPKLRN